MGNESSYEVRRSDGDYDRYPPPPRDSVGNRNNHDTRAGNRKNHETSSGNERSARLAQGIERTTKLAQGIETTRLEVPSEGTMRLGEGMERTMRLGQGIEITTILGQGIEITTTLGQGIETTTTLGQGIETTTTLGQGIEITTTLPQGIERTARLGQGIEGTMRLGNILGLMYMHGRVVRDSESRYSASPFQTKASRANFVKRVYLILTAMLLVDTLFIVLALFVQELRAFLQRDWHGLVIYLVAFVVFLSVYITLACCWYPRHTPPLNWILLCIMCLSMGVMLAALAAFHSVEEILYAAVGTLLVVLCVSLVAMCGTIDITGCGMYLCIAGLVIMMAAIIATTVCVLGLCGSTARIVGLVISIVFVLLFSMYLLYDTQLVLGGGRVQLAEDEYLLGAIHLWVDIVQIFLCMLGISSY